MTPTQTGDAGSARPAVQRTFGARRDLERMLRFGSVGASGLLVNTAVLYLAVQRAGIHYLPALLVATQASTAWNFFLTDQWVFESSQRRFGTAMRFGQFWMLNNTFLLARGPVVLLLAERLGQNYLVANLTSLILMMAVRFLVADRLIWHPDANTGLGMLDTLERDQATTVGERWHDHPIAQPSIRRPSIRRPSIPRPSALGATLFCSILAIAVGLRTVHLNALGFNSDEAVYAGQAASLAGDTTLAAYFPIFRAHPLFFHTTLSLVFKWTGTSPLAARLTAVVFGVATVGVCYLLGKAMYGRRTGVIAALILAVMPYHVVVTRQVLLDGPMVLFSTISLYLLTRYVDTQRVSLLYASSAMLGLTTLTNERSIILVGAIYLFFALEPGVKVRFHQLGVSMLIFVAMVLPYPLSVHLSGKTSTGTNFLVWQLFRKANHGPGFYFATVPAALGWLTVLSAVAGLVALRRRNSWREVLLGTWCLVPFLFFEVWPVKGFQYLLALAPPMAVLAARALGAIPDWLFSRFPLVQRGAVRTLAIAVVVATLAWSSWGRVAPSQAGETFLAGSGGVPGGRESGEWVAENIPQGTQMLAIGPSMANIIQWYGNRKIYALSVSPNPLHRNPVYEPVPNPDLLLRNGDINYLVWDSFSAGRSEFFSEKLLTFAERYHGRIIHEEFVDVATEDGGTVRLPVIVIYEVRP